MRLTVAILLAAAATAAGAQSAPSASAPSISISRVPLDFKGVLVGQPTTEASVQAVIGGMCWKGVCGGKSTIAGVPAEVTVFVESGSVSRISITFAATSFDDVAAALTEKFGKPFAQSNTQVQNGFGARARQTTMLWKTEDGSWMVAKERAEKLSQSSLTMVSGAEVKRIDDREAGNRKDL